MPRLGGSQSHRHPPGFLRASAALSGSRHPVLGGGVSRSRSHPAPTDGQSGAVCDVRSTTKSRGLAASPPPSLPEAPRSSPKVARTQRAEPQPRRRRLQRTATPLCPLPAPLQAGFSPSAPWLRTHLDVRHLPRGSAAPRCAPRHGTTRHGTAPGGEGAATKAPRGWGAPSGRGEPPPRPPHPRLVGKMRGGFVL